jgi:DNA mismatch repair ATPase MutS
MFINSQTIVNLEILTNIKSNTTDSSLFDILKYNKTPMGQRRLRTSLLQPLTGI